MPSAQPSDSPDYVIAGHVACDLVDGEVRPGGTVLYSGAMAANLGRRVGIVTAGPVDLSWSPSLAAMLLVSIASHEATTFAIESGASRPLRLLRRAQGIGLHDIPWSWRNAQLLHLAPIAGEIPAMLPTALQARKTVATPQGWLRRVLSDGTVVPAPEQLEELPLETLAALVVSSEDVAGRDDLVRRAAARVPAVVLTRGSQGCTLFVGGQGMQIDAFDARAVDTIGAGDVFAAAFFVRMDETGDPVHSARFATCAASLSVEGRGLGSVPARERIEARMRDVCRP